jgi:hypothetical protein
MDVRLNNRNTFDHPELKDVVFLVEATSTEKHNLWEQWSLDYQKTFATQPISVGERNIDRIRSLDPLLDILLTAVDMQKKKIEEKHKHRVKWEQISTGFVTQIGKIGSRPITVEFSFAMINGKKVAFYNGCSQVVDHEMIHDWLIKHFQLTHDNYTQWNHTDADNFHNCVNSLDNLDKEPRKTKYKKS